MGRLVHLGVTVVYGSNIDMESCANHRNQLLDIFNLRTLFVSSSVSIDNKYAWFDKIRSFLNNIYWYVVCVHVVVAA